MSSQAIDRKDAANNLHADFLNLWYAYGFAARALDDEAGKYEDISPAALMGCAEALASLNREFKALVNRLEVLGMAESKEKEVAA